jgi:pimeloyl-ACP methyl ester carboxylesterase
MHLKIRGTKLHILESGLEAGVEVPTMVFIHGAGGDSSMWNFQEKDLSKKCRVLIVELPAHGRSLGSGESEIGEYAGWVKEIIKESVVGNYILAGHSMGGAVSMQIAAEQPSKLSGLILVGTGAKLGVARIILRQLREDPESFYQTIEKAALWSEAGPEVKDLVLASIRRCAPSVTHGDFKACDRFDIRERLSEIRVPVLIICGTEDLLTPVAYSEYLNREIKGSKLAIVPGAGHMVMMEKPEPVNQAMIQFLESIG